MVKEQVDAIAQTSFQSLENGVKEGNSRSIEAEWGNDVGFL
jgi:hypothetical protein